MSNTPVSDIHRSIRRGEPISKYGLIWHPVKMEHYEEFCAAKPALLLRQSTLPAKYAAMDFLSAVYAMDYDSITSTGKPIGNFYRLCLMLAMALRLPLEHLDALIRIEAGNGRNIQSLIIQQESTIARITPAQFRSIRQIIAEQNGETLPDESDNAELIQAEQEFAEIRSESLEYDIDALLDSVAYNSGVSLDEIMQWTIRQFEIRRKTIRRDKLFSIYTQAEMSGMVKFTKGNPYPSYEFDRRKNGLDVLIAEREIAEKYGKVADMKLPQ